jgi:hypothetical protein
VTAPCNLHHRSWLPHRLLHCVHRAPCFRRRGKPRHRQPRSPSPRQVPTPTNLSSVATPGRGVFRHRGSQRCCPVRRPISHRCCPAHLSPPPLARCRPSRSRPWIVVLGQNTAMLHAASKNLAIVLQKSANDQQIDNKNENFCVQFSSYKLQFVVQSVLTI